MDTRLRVLDSWKLMQTSGLENWGARSGGVGWTMLALGGQRSEDDRSQEWLRRTGCVGRRSCCEDEAGAGRGKEERTREGKLKGMHRWALGRLEGGRQGPRNRKAAKRSLVG